MPLVRDEELVRVDLPADGEYAMVKPRPSKGERGMILAAGVAFSVKGRLSGEAELERKRHSGLQQKQNGKAGSPAEFEVDMPVVARDLARVAYPELQFAVKELWVSAGPGRPVEKIENPSLDVLEELDEESFSALEDAVKDLWAVRSDDERGNSSNSVATSTEGSKEPAGQPN